MGLVLHALFPSVAKERDNITMTMYFFFLGNEDQECFALLLSEIAYHINTFKTKFKMKKKVFFFFY